MIARLPAIVMPILVGLEGGCLAGLAWLAYEDQPRFMINIADDPPREGGVFVVLLLALGLVGPPCAFAFPRQREGLARLLRAAGLPLPSESEPAPLAFRDFTESVATAAFLSLVPLLLLHVVASRFGLRPPALPLVPEPWLSVYLSLTFFLTCALLGLSSLDLARERSPRSRAHVALTLAMVSFTLVLSACRV